MKKSIALFLSIVLLLGLCGCGNHTATPASSGNEDSQNTSSNTSTEILSEESEKKLGIIFCEVEDDGSEENMLDSVCTQAGISSDAYSEIATSYCISPMDAAACTFNFLDAKCTDVLFVMYSDEYTAVADDMVQEYPNINFYTVSLEPEPVTFTITACKRSYSDSRAWVEFKDDNGKVYCVLVDEEGNAKYISDHFVFPDNTFRWLNENERKVVSFNKGNTVIDIRNGYRFIDRDGKTIKELLIDDSVKEYDILGYWNHTWLIGANISSFTDNGYYIMFLSDDGTLFNEKLNITDNKGAISSLGEGYFLMTKNNSTDMAIIDVNKKSIASIPNRDKYEHAFTFLSGFNDGECLIWYMESRNAHDNNYAYKAITPDDLDCLTQFAEFKLVDDYLGSIPGKTFNNCIYPPVKETDIGNNHYYCEGTYYSFDGSLITTIPQFPENVKIQEYGVFSGEFAPLLLMGADYCYYVTMLCKDGSLLYDPIKINKDSDYGEYFHGYFKTGSDSYIDPEGKLHEDSGDFFIEDLVGIAQNLTTINIKSDNRSKYYDEGVGILYDNKMNIIKSWDGKKQYNYITLQDDTIFAPDCQEPYKAKSETTSNDVSSNDSGPKSIEKTYATIKNFTIEGKWKSVGSDGFGQAQPGNIVAFDGTNCNFLSPKDTYAFYKDGDNYKLDCTSVLGTDTVNFTVKTVNENNIDVIYGDTITELTRVN